MCYVVPVGLDSRDRENQWSQREKEEEEGGKEAKRDRYNIVIIIMYIIFTNVEMPFFFF